MESLERRSSVIFQGDLSGTNEESKADISSLPSEIILSIFKYSKADELKYLSFVNRTFRWCSLVEAELRSNKVIHEMSAFVGEVRTTIEKMDELAQEIKTQLQGWVDECQSYADERVRLKPANTATAIKSKLAPLEGFWEGKRADFVRITFPALDHESPRKERVTLSPIVRILSKIESEEIRLQIAKSCVKKNPSVTSYFLQIFKINNEKYRFELAKIVAEHPHRTILANQYSNILVNIENFDLSDIYRFEILKVVANHHSETFLRSFMILGLNQVQRFELSKILASKIPDKLSKMVECLELSEEDRFEIAKIAVEKDCTKTSAYLENYKLSGGQLFELAKIAAAFHPFTATLELGMFKLFREEDRFEVAKIAVKQDAANVSAHISCFKLKLEERRFEVAKIAAEKNGYMTSENIGCFTLMYHELSREYRYQVAKIAATGNRAQRLKEINERGYPITMNMVEFLDRYCLSNSQHEKIVELCHIDAPVNL